MISSWKYSKSNLFYSFYDLLKGFSKIFTCVSFAEPPKFGRRFLLLSGGDPLQVSIFSTISASQQSAKGARVFLELFDFASKNKIFLAIQNKLEYYRVKKNYKASNAAWKRQIYYVSGFFLSKRWRFLLIFGTSKQIKQNKPSFLLLEPNKIKTHVLLHSLIHTLIKPRSYN